VRGPDVVWRLTHSSLNPQHRYYGESKIHGNQDLKYLSHDSALADFAALITSFKRNTSATGPVISFGGSYGGSKAISLEAGDLLA
jgi:hypothetical protein